MDIIKLKEEVIGQFAIKIAPMNDEASLKIVLDFLYRISAEDKDGINLSRHYDSIKLKYGTVLRKLAR